MPIIGEFWKEASTRALPPMLQPGEVAVVYGSPISLGLIVGVGHMLDQEIQESVLTFIGKLTVSVASFAVILVERAVGFAADHRVIGKRHPAAHTRDKNNLFIQAVVWP